MRRSGSFVTILIAAVFLAGCDIGFFNNGNPSFLPYVSGELDLRSVLPADIRTVDAYAALLPDGTRYFGFVVEPDGPGDNTLVIVDESLIAVVQEEASPLSFNSRLFARIDGSLQIGTFIYNPATGSVSNGAGLDGVFRSVIHDNGRYLTPRPESDFQLAAEIYDASFVSAGVSLAVDALAPASSVFEVTFHLRYPATGFADPDEYIVFVNTIDGVRRGYLSRADLVLWTAAVGPGGLPLDSTSGIGEQTLPLEDLLEVRETPAGILDVDGGILRRFDATTGAFLDDFELNDNPRTERAYPVLFDPRGEFYLVLDTANRALYKVEPWW